MQETDREPEQLSRQERELLERKRKRAPQYKPAVIDEEEYND